jgi:hypothetical protein
MLRKAFAAALMALACFFAFAPLANAQSVTPFSVTAGTGTPLCNYKVDGTNYAGCVVQYVWNGSAWVILPTDSSGHPAVVELAPYSAAAYEVTSANTLTSNTAMVAPGNLMSNNATPGSITFNALALRYSGQMVKVIKGRLAGADTSGALNNVEVLVNVYKAQPTYDAASGDHLAWKLSTGLGNGVLVLTLVCKFKAVTADDGNSAECYRQVGEEGVFLASGANLYWDMVDNTASNGTLTASQTYTLSLDLMQ